MAVYGHISEFSLESEDLKTSWEEYCERLAQYFIANGLEGEPDAAKRKAIFLSSVGGEVYSLIKTLCQPDKPETKTLEQLQKTVKDHLSPAPIVIAERYAFYNRRQQSGESAAQFMKELRRLASTCDFHADYRDDVLRDMLVIGIHDRDIQKKLLRKENLTLTAAFQMVQADERAKSQVDVISAEIHKTTLKVRPSKSDATRSNGSGNSRSGRPCFTCGSLDHWKADCPKHKEKSSAFTKKGHKYRKSNHNDHKVDDMSESDSDQETTKVVRLAKVETAKSVKRVPEIMIDVDMDGQAVSMELDTGASVSLMSHTMFKQLFPQVKLKPSSIVLNTVTGQPMNVVGKHSVTVTHNEVTHTDLCLFVVDSTGAPLLGRDWLSVMQLNWAMVKSVAGADTELRERTLKKKFSELFDGSLGKVKGVEATLELREDARPRFFKPRPVPFAVQQPIGDELESQLKSGILRKLEYSDWASPIVSLRKPSGAWRICGDYKVTLNKFLKIPEHPMPRVEELLAKMNGGQTFSKLDLSQAYLHIPLDEDSQKLVAINTHRGLFTYTRMPYGIASAPAYFQSVMDKVLQGVNCGCYLDDIVVTGKNMEEHMENLTSVMDRLRQYGFRLQEKKCEFFRPSIKYLGQVIDKNGIRIDEAGTAAMPKTYH